jgi:putative ATP-binding cassette transporter
MFSYTVPNLLLGIVVFILPMFSSMSAEVVVKIVATTLFVIAPVEAIVSALPLFVRANITVKHLHQLELELDASSKQIASVEQTEDKRFFDFKNIQLEEIIFQYRDKQDNQLFHVGPINLTIQQGEILFIVGGNGSGKSTLLKLLTGLYYPSTGVIVVDSEMIDKYNYQAYRELFSIIFTDFHLFDRVYGLPTVDEQQLQALLQLMELEQKTKYFDGQFTHLNLSTGQKKRLAFIVAVLENKPIYIFDELAADQDPHFRKFFYREVLLDLRNQGKTIIAVTHDDKYFEVADRVLKMDYGQIVDWDWK